VSLLGKAFDLIDVFGKFESGNRYSSDYLGLLELIWKGGNFVVVTDSIGISPNDDDVEILRATSYSPGSYFVLKPKDSTITLAQRISVGMTKAQLNKLLNLDNSSTKEFVRNGTFETWNYFDGLNVGVLIKDDKVSGITVSPAE
jgi:hypothetical protein